MAWRRAGPDDRAGGLRGSREADSLSNRCPTGPGIRHPTGLPLQCAPSAAKCDHGPVPDGLQIRELPDGGKEFVLDDPALSFIRIDDQSRLQFGDTEMVIGIPFTLELDGNVHHLDPQRTDALGPLVALYPSTMRWLWTSVDGELTAVFEGGAKV